MIALVEHTLAEDPRKAVRLLIDRTECGVITAREALRQRNNCLACSEEYILRTGLAANWSFEHRYPLWQKCEHNALRAMVCGFKLTVQTDEHGHAHKTFECELPRTHVGRYGSLPIIEHRQGMFQWMEHALATHELIALEALRRASDRAGIPGLSDRLIEGKETVAKLAAMNYAANEGGMWRVTALGREVLRMRFP